MLFEMSNVSAGYGSRTILWDLSATVAADRVLAILGPNGAGKTTLARAISGSLPLSAGAITFDGTRVEQLTPEARARKGMIHVPQGRRVFPDLTVRENLSVAQFAVGNRGNKETLNFVFELFPKLEELIRRQAGSLSGGEQQMLAVGRALMAEPKLLVLDEPSLGLSPLMVQNLYGAIKVIRTRGVGVIVIEQMVGAALSVADEVMVLESGRIVSSGDAEQFRSSPELLSAYLGTTDK